jgi:hypothetical protein
VLGEQVAEFRIEADRIGVHPQIEPTVWLDLLTQHFNRFAGAFDAQEEWLAAMKYDMGGREPVRLRVFRDAQCGLLHRRE